MSINARQVHIISLLLDENRYMPTAELALASNCSERTVRNDVRAINAFFIQEHVGVRVVSKRGNGIRLHASAAEREHIQGAVQERALAVDTDLDRFYRGMLLLTCDYRRRFTTESLARACLTNKQQCQEDLRHWNELLAPYQAQIVRRRHISVEGNEEYIRWFVVYYLFDLASTAMKRRIEPQIFVDDRSEKTQTFFDAEIDAVERATDYPYTDNARHQIAVYLQVMVFRVLQGKVLAGGSSLVPAPFETLADHVEERFGITLPPAERAVVRDLFTVSTRRWTPDFQNSFTPAADAQNHALALFSALEQRFEKRPAAHLKKPLAALLQAAGVHARLELSISLPRENTWTVRFENMASYLRLMEIMRDTKDLQSLSFYATDYTRIAMLLLSYLDGVTPHDLWRVGLVVNCGIEQVFYARDRIERLIPCTKIARVLTEQELTQDAGEDAACGLDFLVSFDPVETKMPLALISTAISERDRNLINDVIMQLGCPGAATHEPPLSNKVPYRKLEITPAHTLRRELHRALVADGLWKGPLSSFSTAMEMGMISVGSWGLFTTFSDDVGATGAVRYEVNANMGYSGEKLRHVMVLTVARQDERALTPLTLAFKSLAVEAGFPAA